MRTKDSKHVKKNKKTTEQFKKEVYDLANGEYEVLGEYISNNTRIKFKHLKCGHEYETRPRNFTSAGSRCPKCRYKIVAEKNSVKNMQTKEEFIDNINRAHGKNEIILLSDYLGLQNKMKFKHNNELCNNHEFEMHGGNIYRYGCPSVLHKKARDKDGKIVKYEPVSISERKICHGQKGKIATHEDVIKKLKEIGMEDYEILTEFKGVKVPLEIKCKKCNTITKRRVSKLYKKHYCTRCSYDRRNKERIIPYEEIQRRIDEQYGEGKYIPMSEYVDTRVHMNFKHTECGFEWSVSPQNITRGYACPYCNKTTTSKGERMLYEIFNEYNINYKNEVSFEDLKVQKKLRYDFGIYDENDNLLFLIEYNGQQHYKDVKYFGRQKLKERRNYDLMKIQYAKSNKVPLGIIPYNYKKKKDIIRLLKKNQIIK